MIEVHGSKVVICNNPEEEGITVDDQVALALASLLRSILDEEELESETALDLLAKISAMARWIALDERAVKKEYEVEDTPKPFKMMFKQKGEEK